MYLTASAYQDKKKLSMKKGSKVCFDTQTVPRGLAPGSITDLLIKKAPFVTIKFKVATTSYVATCSSSKVNYHWVSTQGAQVSFQ